MPGRGPPDAWRQTVRRMADRTTLLDPLDEEQQWQVTAYLVALSPQLQQSVQQMREQQERRDETKQAAASMTGKREEPSAYDAVQAKRLFETKCSECHKLTLVEKKPPDSEDAARDARRADGRRGADGQGGRTRADRALPDRDLREEVETVARATTLTVPGMPKE